MQIWDVKTMICCGCRFNSSWLAILTALMGSLKKSEHIPAKKNAYKITFITLYHTYEYMWIHMIPHHTMSHSCAINMVPLHADCHQHAPLLQSCMPRVLKMEISRIKIACRSYGGYSSHGLADSSTIWTYLNYPRSSMYGIFTYIYPINEPVL